MKHGKLRDHVLFTLAGEAYGADLWPENVEQARKHEVGDTLADFIVLELNEAVDWDDPKAAPEELLGRACDALNSAMRQLAQVVEGVSGLRRELAEMRGEPSTQQAAGVAAKPRRAVVAPGM